MTPFSEYFHQWLYSKNGYYASMPQIGKNGDFYTSVSTSMFFGGSIANHLLQTIDSGFLSPFATVVEIGAHRGYLLADMIQFIYTLRPSLLKTLKFAIVEPFENVKREQEKYFQKCFGKKLHVNIVDDIKKLSCNEAFIVSNELFDAFACEVIMDDKMLFMDLHVTKFKSLDKNTKELSQKYNIKKGEIPINLEKFADDIYKSFRRYKFITFDYGQKEPRGDISLRVYSNHKVYPFFELTPHAGTSNQLSNFFAKSDITYDVCFSLLQNIFEKNGVKMERFCTQMVALSEFGITDLLKILQKNSDEKTYKHELEKAKQLILPNFFGERFKMISFIKN